MSSTMFIIHLSLFGALILASVCSAKPPNIVFVLTDDQDSEIGGMTPLTKTKKLIGRKGLTFQNMFVTTPVCCPSRSSIFTGKYQHNHHCLNNTIEGGCSNQTWQETQETEAFPVYLHNQGYNTFFAGKYLNMYGLEGAGGVEHVPPGWDSWIGLVGNSVYYDYTLSVNGTEEKHGHNYTDDYLTDIIHKHAADFLRDKTNDSSPFFMMLSTPSCHDPWEAAPQYQSSYSDTQAPRTPSFNRHGKSKHWLVETAVTPMTNQTITFIDEVYRNRWRTLLSVDDMVADVVDMLETQGLMDNTYIFFSSDNGYHIGQFSMPTDKRLLYEFDVRVPLLVRGPGVPGGSVIKDIVLNIDFAPTFLELAGVTPPVTMDGMSIVPLLHQKTKRDDPPFRTEFLTEYHGEQVEKNPECSQWDNQGMAWCQKRVDCVCEDAWNNTYVCIRKMDDTQHIKYCQFADDEKFEEMYDLSKDHFELMNIAMSHREEAEQLKQEMARLAACVGSSCHSKYRHVQYT